MKSRLIALASALALLVLMAVPTFAASGYAIGG